MINKEDIPAAPCPFCQKDLDRTVVVSDKGAFEPGAWTVCSNCGGILRFTSGMTLRMVTQQEMKELGTKKLSALYDFREELLLRRAMRN